MIERHYFLSCANVETNQRGTLLFSHKSWFPQPTSAFRQAMEKAEEMNGNKVYAVSFNRV